MITRTGFRRIAVRTPDHVLMQIVSVSKYRLISVQGPRFLTVWIKSYVRTSCPTHLILLDFTTRTILGKEYKSLSSSSCNFLHSPVTSSLLGPNTLLNALFSNTLSLRSSLNVSDQVSHPYRTTGKIIVLYILIFSLFDSKLEDKRFCAE